MGIPKITHCPTERVPPDQTPIASDFPFWAYYTFSEWLGLCQGFYASEEGYLGVRSTVELLSDEPGVGGNIWHHWSANHGHHSSLIARAPSGLSLRSPCLTGKGEKATLVTGGRKRTFNDFFFPLPPVPSIPATISFVCLFVL